MGNLNMSKHNDARRKNSRLLLSTCVAIAAALMLNSGTTAYAADGQALTRTQTSVIGPGDDITIQVLGCDELNKAFRVNSSGELSLPLVGTVHAASLTEEQFEKELTDRLVRFMVKPQVTVFVSNFRSGPVVVTGAVTQPGTFQMEGSKTLLNMLVRAGGAKEGGPTITLRRDVRFGEIPYPGASLEDNGKYSVVTLSREAVEGGRADVSDIAIQPFDVIAVSPNKVKNVYIIGEVNRPGVVEVVSRDRMPLMILVAMAGGMTKTAAPKHLRIMESQASGQRITREVNLKNIMTGKVPDYEVAPGDIVVIPTNAVVSYMQTLGMSVASAGASTGMLVLGRF
jgi:polysaccharide export outer membrane protein